MIFRSLSHNLFKSHRQQLQYLLSIFVHIYTQLSKCATPFYQLLQDVLSLVLGILDRLSWIHLGDHSIFQVPGKVLKASVKWSIVFGNTGSAVEV